jgi:hypothetical protein
MAPFALARRPGLMNNLLSQANYKAWSTRGMCQTPFLTDGVNIQFCSDLLARILRCGKALPLNLRYVPADLFRGEMSRVGIKSIAR